MIRCSEEGDNLSTANRTGARRKVAGDHQSEPKLLAHQYPEAGQVEAAIPYWRRAGDLAMQTFALQEAVTHVQRAMAGLGTLQPTRA